MASSLLLLGVSICKRYRSRHCVSIDWCDSDSQAKGLELLRSAVKGTGVRAVDYQMAVEYLDALRSLCAKHGNHKVRGHGKYSHRVTRCPPS